MKPKLAQAYRDLCKKVWRVDRKAHYYLLNKAPLLKGFKSSDYLCVCFLWSGTPQGYEYWHKIGSLIK